MGELDEQEGATRAGSGLVARHIGETGSGPVKWGGTFGSRGLVNGNGLINGNGLVNGNGFVNGAGKGLTGGSGLINGNGLINGCAKTCSAEALAARECSGLRRAAASKRLRLGMMVVVSAVLVVTVPMLAMLMAPAAEKLAVDGDFSDWDGKTILSEGPDRSAISPDLDIVRYATDISGNEAFFFVQVAGKMLSGKGNGVDVVNVFIDSDLDDSTGYSIRGMGADNRVEVWGFDGLARGCGFYKFSLGKGTADWNGWSSLGSGKASASNRGLELSVWKSGLGDISKGGYRVLFQISDASARSSDFSKTMAGPGQGALLIVQKPIDKPALAISPDSQPVLRLAIDARGNDLRLRELVLARSGNATPGDIGEVQIRFGSQVLASGKFTDNILTFKLDLPVRMGKTVHLDVSVRVLDSAAPGAVFGIGLAGHGSARLAKGTATVDGFGLRSYYIGSPPAKITIDGAFGDWAHTTAHPDGVGDSRNPCIDIVDGRAEKDRGALSFLARVDGTMLGGESIPLPFEGRPVPVPAVPPGPSGGLIDRPVLVPRDTVTAYIDADKSNLTGFDVKGTDLGAEYSLVVTGVAGRIQTKEAFSWSSINKSWARIGTFEAVRDPDTMELQAPLASLGMILGPVFRVQIFATDWSGRQDRVDGDIEITDPLQLADDSVIYSSSDGVSWKTETTIDNTKVWRDMCTDTSGNVYTITTGGIVYKSTGDWTKWTKIIDGSLSAIVAIATDGTNFYAITNKGVTYKTTSGNAWSNEGAVGLSKDYEDMCIDSSGNLYVIRSDTCATVFNSSDGGKTWNAFGDKNLGGSGGGVTNVAIIHGAGWASTKYIFVLQSDGGIRYDTNGKSKDPWDVTTACGNITGQTLMDMDLDNANKQLWTVALSGKVYTFNFSDTAPDGTWNTTLGNSSDTGVWAIAVNLIPEFKDLALPVGGMIAIVFIIRTRHRKNRAN